MFLVGVLGLVFTASIADGTKSINRFREGYDFDLSITEEDEKDRNENQ